jgi:hypothetical protein
MNKLTRFKIPLRRYSSSPVPEKNNIFANYIMGSSLMGCYVSILKSMDESNNTNNNYYYFGQHITYATIGLCTGPVMIPGCVCYYIGIRIGKWYSGIW